MSIKITVISILSVVGLLVWQRAYNRWYGISKYDRVSPFIVRAHGM